jgi:hypothetical protein
VGLAKAVDSNALEGVLVGFFEATQRQAGEATSTPDIAQTRRPRTLRIDSFRIG